MNLGSHHVLRTILLALGVVVALTLGAAAASAGEIDPYTTDDTTQNQPSGSGNANVVASNQANNQADRGALAFTGTETLTLALIGAGLVVGGAVFVTASRRKDSAAA